MADPDVIRQLTLQLVNLRAHDETSVREDGVQASINIGLVLPVLCFKVNEFHVSLASSRPVTVVRQRSGCVQAPK